MEYEAREKAIRDYNEGLLKATERGILIGEQRIITLHSFLIQDGRHTDLERSINDEEFRRRLMEEYEL